MTSALEIEVTPEDAGARVDVFLARRMDGVSRRLAKSLAEEGRVRVNGKRVKKAQALAAGDVVAVELPEGGATAAATPDPDLPLVVVHEDAQLVVIDKAAGVPSHSLRPGEVGTAASALLARYPEMAGVGYSPREPGIVHRLDTDTSGLLLAARDAATFEALRTALKHGAIEKRYRALCEGWVATPRSITTPLAPHPRDPKRVLACTEERDVLALRARPALTELVEGDRAGSMTLVTAIARPAGRHQIRAHLAAIGHPLAGDRLYGGPAIRGLERHFLHASEMTFTHPATGAPVTLRSALPPDLVTALDTVRAGG